MHSLLSGIIAAFLIYLISFPEMNSFSESNRFAATEKNEKGALKDRNGNIMRGTPMVLGKNLKSSVDFAADIKNWEIIKENGFNTIRICWVDPWYKDHGRDFWTVGEMLPWLDKVVENANTSEMNLIINYHNVGPQQNFDTTYTFQLEKEFWEYVAPRYKDNDLVYYELTNEPTFRMSDYLKPEFSENLMQIYRQIRKDAPEREILMFSFNTIQPEILDVVKHYENELDWNFTTVAYHMYNSTSSDAVKKLMEKHRVICTEWFYHFVSLERPDYTFIKQVDGYKENAQTLEMIGSGWIDWRDWDDTSLNELLDTLITDAKLKNYWWK
jgi:aryl-phospho-beta-D-glucosidase BglC (GH1 family)